MAYSTQADIEKLIPRDLLVKLTDDEGLRTVNAERVAEAVEQADAEIDAYISKRYGVPLDPVPALVKKLSVDMAVYNLYSRTVMSAPEIRRERYADAIKRLEAIARGTAGLGIAEEPAPPPDASTGETTQTADSQVFTREKLRGF
jgi:phage gp36-like protein